jgi:hypothetical protein
MYVNTALRAIDNARERDRILIVGSLQHHVRGEDQPHAVKQNSESLSAPTGRWKFGLPSVRPKCARTTEKFEEEDQHHV